MAGEASVPEPGGGLAPQDEREPAPRDAAAPGRHAVRWRCQIKL